MPSDPTDMIRAFWEERALDPRFGEETVTLPDRHQRLLEIELLLQYLPEGQHVLDVGCGNGFSTAVFARHAVHVLGVDYSRAMIERARREFGHLPNITFEVRDVLELDLPPKSFDVAISQRCLINLPTWESQQAAIANIAAVVKAGGYFLFQEGTRQGREGLNQLRELVGLIRMPVVPHNLDFDEEVLWPFVRRYFDVVEIRRPGVYDLISRVVHPLLVSPAGPEYDAKINEVARRIASKFRGADEVAREFTAFLRRLEA